MGEDRFQVKTHGLQQILDLGRYNFLPVAPMVMILVFLKSQCRELSKNVYFYPILTYSFRVMILSSKMCRNTPNLSEPPPPPPFNTPCKSLKFISWFCSKKKSRTYQLRVSSTTQRYKKYPLL